MTLPLSVTYSTFDIFQKVVFLSGALYRRSKFENFCHDLKKTIVVTIYARIILFFGW